MNDAPLGAAFVGVGEVAMDGPPCVMVGVILRNDLKPTCGSPSHNWYAWYNISTYLCHNFSDLSEVCTPTHVTLRQKIFDEPCPNIVAHLLELLVYFVIILVILDELHDQGTIRESKQFCILPLDVRYNQAAQKRL